MTTTTPSETISVSIDRVFDAALDRIWQMFTEADELAVWGVGDWYDNVALDIDVRPGGVIHHRVVQKSDHSMWTFRGVYQEVEELSRLAYTFDWKTDWRDEPSPSLVDIDFAATDDGKTAVHLEHSGIPPGPAAESTQEHWNAFLDRLAELA